ncbi:hypothetical protein LJC04_05735 [Ruminococcaceae bacterium OttesenSCG-928-O06]|nr:hypothetical protein [Ruminococcaceae bacterium OttesenSCG-928-O06]
MPRKTKYDWILEQYPEAIKKEQFYRICHISKKTASLLLKRGLIPCENTGRKTRQYIIATRDVVAFLLERERNPDKFKMPEGSYASGRPARPENLISPTLLGEQACAFYTMILEPFEDVMMVMDVHRAIGYGAESIHKWCHKGRVIHFVIDGRFMIPKVSLLNFMLTREFKGIKYRDEEQKAQLLELLKTIE